MRTKQSTEFRAS